LSQTLPAADELKASYLLFSNFVFLLLGEIGEKKENLMIAAVNSQIALELFLKYLFTARGKVDEIRKKKGGVLVNEFKDFNEILNHFYSSKSWSFGNKKEFIELMQARNSIVHRGQRSQWDPELAKIIVKTHFFIHATAWSELGEVLLSENYTPHKISELEVWRTGVEEFCDDLSELYDCYPLNCSRCYSRSVVSGELFVLEEGQTDGYIVCLCCLSSINIEHEARLIDCYVCSEESYLLDAFNEQAEQLYFGKCTDCDTDTWVRKCANCEKFYHPAARTEARLKDAFFCSENCKEYHEEAEKHEASKLGSPS
jgi:hypothetical protein